MTTLQELAIVRSAIQQIISGEMVASVNFGGMSVSYHSSRMEFLQKREEVLMARLSTTATRYRSSLSIA